MLWAAKWFWHWPGLLCCAAITLAWPLAIMIRYPDSAELWWIHTFGRGHLEQLGGDYISVNLNCLDDLDLSQVKVMYWDGRHNNWAAGPSEAPYSPGGR